MKETVARTARGALSAITVLTRVPVPRHAHGEGLRYAAPWMPVVGATIGVASALAWAAGRQLSASVGAVAAVTTSLVLTGCLHEDGLADTADALGGASTRERIFEILKDSRVGSFGAAAIVLSVVWRIALIVSLGRGAVGPLVVAHTLARLATVWMMGTLPYVTPAAVARSRLAGGIGAPSTIVATAATIGVLFLVREVGLVAWPLSATLLSSLACVVAAFGLYFRHRCGGITGDFLGTVEQVSECWVLALCAIASGRR